MKQKQSTSGREAENASHVFWPGKGKAEVCMQKRSAKTEKEQSGNEIKRIPVACNGEKQEQEYCAQGNETFSDPTKQREYKKTRDRKKTRRK